MSFSKTTLFPCNPTTERGRATKLSSNKDRIAYTSGKSVIIRDLKSGASVAYSGHVQSTTVARISPTGYYCASADASGTVRVWDTLGEDQTLKGEFKVIVGRINDLEWDGESKRIIAVGDGREKFGHAFMFDSGSGVGDIIGHSKAINAVSIRQQRPYRAATAGDDASIVFHHGTPYKYDKTIKTHTKFVQDVRYAPSGDHFASVGSDAKIFVYDGKTGDTLGEFTDSPHTGSIMASSWSPDSSSLITSSADGTVKLWDVESRKAVQTWSLGSGVSHQQVGNTWSGSDDIVSLSLFGDLNVFDKRVGDKPARILNGSQKAITSFSSTSSGTFLAGTADGRVLIYTTDGEASVSSGEGHSNYVSAIASTSSGKKAFSVGFDDRVREIEGETFTQSSSSTSSQPKSIAVSDDETVFVAEGNSVEVFKSNQKVHELASKFSPSAIDVVGSTGLVAVGGEDMKVRLYEWDGKTLKEASVLEGNKGVVSSVAFSPNGAYLAAGDSTGRIVLFDANERTMITSRWSFHSARVNSLSWTEDSEHVASGSLDTHVYVWSVKKPMKNIAIKNAGPGGVNAVLWTGDGKLISSGADGVVRVWDVKFHA